MAARRAAVIAAVFVQRLSQQWKWQFQPDRRSTSWRLSIATHAINWQSIWLTTLASRQNCRRRGSAYRYARRYAVIETGFPEDTFPIACQWTFDQAMQDEL